MLDLVTVVDTIGNPLDEDSLSLLLLMDTKYIVEPRGIDAYVKHNGSERTTLQVLHYSSTIRADMS